MLSCALYDLVKLGGGGGICICRILMALVHVILSLSQYSGGV